MSAFHIPKSRIFAFPYGNERILGATCLFDFPIQKIYALIFASQTEMSAFHSLKSRIFAFLRRNERIWGLLSCATPSYATHHYIFRYVRFTYPLGQKHLLPKHLLPKRLLPEFLTDKWNPAMLFR